MKPFENFTKIYAVTLSLLIFSQCQAEQSLSAINNTNQEDDDELTFQEAIGGNVSEISVDGGSSQITFSDLSDDENVAVILYSANNNSTSHSFELSSSSNAASFLTTGSDDHDHDHSGDNHAQIAGHDDMTAMFHNDLRDIENLAMEEGATQATPNQNSGNMLFATSGSQRSFKVLNSFSNSLSYETITAENRYETDDFIFYVDTRDADALSDTELETLALQYQAILDTERSFFGDESDVDENGKFYAVFTRVVNELGAQQGGIVTGFFYALDLLDPNKYAISNAAEVLYTFIPDPDGEHGVAISNDFALENILPGVLVHEFQHMINFNQHYFVQNSGIEESWLNEGLSHFAEDLYSLNGQGVIDGYGLENPARAASYLSDLSNICFTCGSDLSQRGGAYLFIKYLYEQAELGKFNGVTNGIELINNLVMTNKTGTDNVENAVFGDEAGDFKDLLGLFSLALYLSDTGLSTDDRFQFTGFQLIGDMDDNRGTVLEGPAQQSIQSLPFNDALLGNGITILQIPGSVINQNGGTLDIHFGSGSDFGGYLIRAD